MYDFQLKELNQSDLANECSKGSIHDNGSQWLHLSRLGNGFNGSTKILCFELKVAFLVLWCVNHNDHRINVVPIINSSPLAYDILHKCCEEMFLNLTRAFEEQLKHYYNNVEDKFQQLISHIVSSEEQIDSQISKKIRFSLRPTGEKSMSISLKKMLKNTAKSIEIKQSLDYFDIFASTNLDCGYRVASHEMKYYESSDINTCTICFDDFDGNELYLTTCSHKVCQSCWK